MDLFLFTPLVAQNKEVEAEGSEGWVLAGTRCFHRGVGNLSPVGAKREKGKIRHQPLTERNFLNVPRYLDIRNIFSGYLGCGFPITLQKMMMVMVMVITVGELRALQVFFWCAKAKGSDMHQEPAAHSCTAFGTEFFCQAVAGLLQLQMVGNICIPNE